MRTMKDEKKLVQFKIDSEDLDKIDDYVQKAQKGDEEMKKYVKIDKFYTRSDFIREACEEKLELWKRHGEDIIVGMERLMEKKMKEPDFQKVMIFLISQAMANVVKNETFDITKALPGLDLQSIFDQSQLLVGSGLKQIKNIVEEEE